MIKRFEEYTEEMNIWDSKITPSVREILPENGCESLSEMSPQIKRTNPLSAKLFEQDSRKSSRELSNVGMLYFWMLHGGDANVGRGVAEWNTDSP